MIEHLTKVQSAAILHLLINSISHQRIKFPSRCSKQTFQEKVEINVKESLVCFHRNLTFMIFNALNLTTSDKLENTTNHPRLNICETPILHKTSWMRFLARTEWDWTDLEKGSLCCSVCGFHHYVCNLANLSMPIRWSRLNGRLSEIIEFVFWY